MIQLQRHAMTSGFDSASLRPGTLAMGHFLNVDHFRMTHPTFPPHPHAGFSVLTYMLPWSAGAFVNRDSQGSRSLIGPGDFHWTLAGANMIHEEIPEIPGITSEGLQIFLKLPEADELRPPTSYHATAAEIPVISFNGGDIRIIFGRIGETESQIPTYAGSTLLHVTVRSELSLEIPRQSQAFFLVLRGDGAIGAERFAQGTAGSISSGSLLLTGNADVLIGSSDPMPRQPQFQGPFCMFQPERLLAANPAYRQGEMGALSPSPVAWVR
jgi:redox-sensitive bicupin YhaK (pirin superfamily)